MLNEIKNQVYLSLWLSKTELKSRYNRTTLGPFWSTLILITTVFTIGPLYSYLFASQDKDYIINLSLGLYIWYFISNSINDSTASFVTNNQLYKIKNLGTAFPALKCVIMNFFISMHQIVGLVIIFCVFDISLLLKIPIIIIYMSLLVPLIFPLVYFISLISLKFRDITYIVSSVLNVIFFLTPIIWTKNFLPDNKVIFIDINPIYHVINILKEGVLRFEFELNSFVIVFLLSFILWSITLILKKYFKNNFLYWLN